MKKYSEDYTLETITDEKGREKEVAVYKGDYFNISFNDGTITDFRKTALLLFAALTILHVSAGFLNNLGMFQFYVAIPYVTAFFPLIYLAAGILHIPKPKQKYQRDEVGLSFERMKTSVMTLLIMLGIGLLGALVFLVFFSSPAQWLKEIIFLALEGLSFTAGYVLSRQLQRLKIQKIENLST